MREWRRVGSPKREVGSPKREVGRLLYKSSIHYNIEEQSLGVALLSIAGSSYIYVMRLRYISLLLALFFTGILCAQSPDYRLETFGTRDGMLSSKIYSLAQTTDRRLWIGTELGVSIYDGYRFSNYQYTAGHESIGRILCITQDKQHNVWLGGDKGLFLFSNDSIYKMNVKNRPTMAVEAMLTDKEGNIFLGELTALYKLSPAQIISAVKNTNALLDATIYAGFTKRVFSIATDRQQNLYVGSFDGVFMFPANNNSYRLYWSNPDVFKEVLSVTALSPDSVFWTKVDAQPYQSIKGKVKQFIESDVIGRSVFIKQDRPYALTSSGVAQISDGALQPVVSITGITNNVVASIIDAEGNIWISSWEGLLKYRKTAFRQYALHDEKDKQAEIFSMIERNNGELLFGSNHGKIFSKQNGVLSPHMGIPKIFPDAEVMCMTETSDNALWIGSGYQGIARFKNNKLTNWGLDSMLKDENCEMLYPAMDGRLLACTEQGVTVVDPRLESPMVKHYPFIKKYSRYPELFGVFQSGSSPYWCYGSGGFYQLINEQLVDDSISGMPVKSLYINKIIADKKGNVWIATHGMGLMQCRIENNNRLVLIKRYDQKSGTPSNNALSVLVDKNDNIWWGDYMSVSVLLNPGTAEQLISFNEKDGLLSSYYQTLKMEQQRDGTIWGLTTMGAFAFHPDSIGRNELPPVLMLDSIASRDGSTLGGLDMPVLSYVNNSIRFHFTAICLSDPSKIRYAYRLKELDSNWTYTSGRVASFNFLQPGKYTFELKACNNNNIWTPVISTYKFRIRPPFWQTWWFRGLIILLVTTMIYLLFRRRISAFKTKAAIRQQMAELEAKAIRAQMNPHFIFNSLNAIQESIVLHDYDTSYQYLSKFSKLLRLVLNNSEKNVIPLADEIEMNRLYLELESLRFKHSFSYSIRVDDLIDTELVRFPSLMLQPFIENAIWHGLMHKEGEKILSIVFRQKVHELECVIEDNGIGREKAGAIKQQKLGAHHFESKGTNLARQRIHLLQVSGAMSATLHIEDLANEKGEPCGTRVIIRIPFAVLR
jgi:ligand-binding sensor domain-containing protein